MTLPGEEQEAGGVYSDRAYLGFINWRGLNLSCPSCSVTLSNLLNLFLHLQNRDSYTTLWVEFLGVPNGMYTEETLHMRWHTARTP